MATFYTDIEIEHHVQRGLRVSVPHALVDTGADATWIPRPILTQLGVTVERTERYRLANGAVVTRDVGYIIVHVAGQSTTDVVVFAEVDDHTILGARSLDGLNLKVDTKNERLVLSGPRLVVVAA